MIGVYAFVPKHQLFPSYIGYSKDVKKRVRSHQANDRPFAYEGQHVMYQPFDCVDKAYLCEQMLIDKFNPTWNKTRKHKLNRLLIHDCESIDEVFDGYENPPWRPLSMIDRIYYNSARKQWQEEKLKMEKVT